MSVHSWFIGHLGLALALGLVACKGDEGGEDASAGESAGESESESAGEVGTRFWEDVAPIYFARCVTCHQQGGIAPLRLDTYEDAKAWGEAAVAATTARTMPPWGVVSDGSCGTFRGSRALADQEIAVIQAWVDGGMIEGEPRSDLAPPASEGLGGAMELRTPDFVPVVQGGPYAAADEYRCFLVDPELAADAFITGYEAIPGEPALVHHVLAIPIDPTRDVGGGMTNLDVIEGLDAESPDRAGWSCFGAAGDGVEIDSMPVIWAPGQGTVEYPEGVGAPLRADDLVVIQVHYNLAAQHMVGASDSTAVRLRLADAVDLEGVYLAIDPFLDTLFEETPDVLPAGMASAPYTWEVPIGAWLESFGLASGRLWGLFPHMHERGRTMTVEVDAAGSGAFACAAEVPAWDFHWQMQYFLEEPIVLGAGAGLRVTCTYDTSDAEEGVTPGWGTENEMCFLGVLVTQ